MHDVSICCKYAATWYQDHSQKSVDLCLITLTVRTVASSQAWLIKKVESVQKNQLTYLHLTFIVLYFTTTLLENHHVPGNKMMNLRPHHRIQVPNGLAILAVLMLLISAAANFETRQETNSSGQEAVMSAKVDKVGSEGVNNAAKSKSSGLNLGLLLFRRG
jgi:cytochrome c biogenesis factor